MPKFILSLLLMLLISACGGGSSSTTTPPPIEPPPPAVETRNFFMGFTPWPFDATTAAINTTYEKVQENSDMINHQIMQGIPWEEALNQTAFPAHFEDEISSRISQTDANQLILVELGSLDSSRTGLANNWGADGEEPRSAPWDSRNFDSAEVITAYSNVAIELINRFQPSYFNYGTEVSELIINDVNQFDKFVIFAEQVYNNIKAAHPDVKLMISVALKSPGSTEMQQILTHMPKIMDYVDVVGISVYPYVFFNHADKGNPDNLTTNWLSQITDFSAGKPIAITETGWIAENLVIDSFGVNVTSSETFQQRYVTLLLQNAEQLNLEFIIWWSVIDFQALWEGVLSRDELAAIWRDIGLYNEQLTPRSGLAIWQQYFQRTKQ